MDGVPEAANGCHACAPAGCPTWIRAPQCTASALVITYPAATPIGTSDFLYRKCTRLAFPPPHPKFRGTPHAHRAASLPPRSPTSPPGRLAVCPLLTTSSSWWLAPGKGRAAYLINTSCWDLCLWSACQVHGACMQDCCAGGRSAL